MKKALSDSFFLSSLDLDFPLRRSAARRLPALFVFFSEAASGPLLIRFFLCRGSSLTVVGVGPQSATPGTCRPVFHELSALDRFSRA
jgi:hypothetical protein